MGDAKLLASLGAWLGLEPLLLILSIAALLGILGGILWLRYKKLPRTHAFPFGPYLAIAGIMKILWSTPSIHLLS
jgi:leader peptidase (prepilin peptidase)/N-methyltransferase